MLQIFRTDFKIHNESSLLQSLLEKLWICSKIRNCSFVTHWFFFYIRIFCSEFCRGKSATKSHWNLHDLVWICHCWFTWGNAAGDNPQHLCPMCKDLKRGPVSSSDRSVLAYTCIFHKRTLPEKKKKSLIPHCADPVIPLNVWIKWQVNITKSSTVSTDWKVSDCR